MHVEQEEILKLGSSGSQMSLVPAVLYVLCHLRQGSKRKICRSFVLHPMVLPLLEDNWLSKGVEPAQLRWLLSAI